MADGKGLGPLAKGLWNLEKSENFDEYMKTVGVGYSTRLVANAAKPTQEIGVTDNRWKITTTTTFTKVDLDFELNKEFDETTADGRKVKSTCRVEGNKLIIEQKGKINSTIVREFTNDSMVMSLTANNVTCKRYYKKEK